MVYRCGRFKSKDWGIMKPQIIGFIIEGEKNGKLEVWNEKMELMWITIILAIIIFIWVIYDAFKEIVNN